MAPSSATLGGTPSPPSAGRWSPHAPSTQLPACGYGRDDGGALLGLGSTPFSLALGIGFALPALLLVVPMQVALIIATSRNSRAGDGDAGDLGSFERSAKPAIGARAMERPHLDRHAASGLTT